MLKRSNDHYTLLGIQRSATPDDIRRAYLKAAKKLHPDHNTAPGDTELFMDVQQAYQVLSDPVRRASYDANLPPEKNIPSIVDKRILVSRKSVSQMTEPQLVYMLIDLEPSKSLQETTGYVPLNLCLVLDSSTSMKGEKLETAKQTAIELIRRLKPQDIFSVVAFNDRAEVIIPSSRLPNPVKMENSIRQIQTSGGTEIMQGLQAGLEELNRYLSPKSINHIILITDGKTYGDEQACYELAKEAANFGIGLTGLGIGSGWNDIFLDKLANLTGGHSMLAPQPKDIEHLLLEKFSNLSKTFAESVSLEYKLENNVRINYAFRLHPITDLIQTASPLRLGPIQLNWPFSVLIEFTIPPQTIEGEFFTLMEGKIEVTATNFTLPVPSMPIEVVLALKETGDLEPPHPAIIQALSKLTLYRLQEKARVEMARGNYGKATEHLQKLATRLLAQGERSLAKTVMLEIASIETDKTYTEYGAKQIKYGTRALLLPEETEK